MPPVSDDNMLARAKSMGLLRNLLHLLAVAYIFVLPFSEPQRVLDGWALVFGGIIPATAPLVFIVMMFDVMMCQILKGEAAGTDVARYNLIVRTHLLLGLTVLALWLFSFRDVLFR